MTNTYKHTKERGSSGPGLSDRETPHRVARVVSHRQTRGRVITNRSQGLWYTAEQGGRYS